MAFDEKNGTETDVEWSRSSSYEGEGEEIKRDLKSRHINMIAIAGMIVSSRPTVLLIALLMKIGNGSVSEFGSGHCHCRPRWRFLSLYPYGLDYCRCFVYHWRDLGFYAL